MMTNSTRMSEVAHGDQNPLVCWNAKCARKIFMLSKYFLDTLWDRVYCHQCGLCLRYARKKAMERGERIEKVEGET